MAIIETLSELLDNVGQLDDSEGDDTARERFRRMLKQKVSSASQIREFVQECLNNSGDQFNKALVSIGLMWLREVRMTGNNEHS